MKRIIFLISVLGIVLAGFCKSNDAEAEQAGQHIVIKSNTPAPDFALFDAEDKAFRLSDNLDKTVVLCFLREMPDKKTGKYWLNISQKWMRHLQEKYGNKIVIIGLKEMTNIPVFIPKSLIKSRLKKQSFRFLIDWDGTVFDQYPSKELFTLYVVSPERNIVYTVSAPYNDSLFVKLCEKGRKLFKKGEKDEK
jgi:hypothetical protein